MLEVVDVIKNATNEGCTDVEALELAVELMQLEKIKSTFRSMNKQRMNEIIIATGNAIENNQDIEDSLYDSLSLLSERERECYLMHYVNLMSFQKIADMLGISKGSVNCYIRRARAKINT